MRDDDEVFDVTVRVRLPSSVAEGGWNGGVIMDAARRCLSSEDEFDGREFVRLSIAIVQPE